MFKYKFPYLYFVLGLGTMALFALGETTGFFEPSFGPRGKIDTGSRQGYWYTYQKPKYDSSSPGRSPGSYGGSSGGYSGGK